MAADNSQSANDSLKSRLAEISDAGRVLGDEVYWHLMLLPINPSPVKQFIIGIVCDENDYRATLR